MNIQKIERKSVSVSGMSKICWQGVLSVILLCLEIIIMLVAFYISYLSAGKAGITAGLLGLAAVIAAVCGIIAAALGIRSAKYRRKLCAVGLVGNTLMLVGMIILYSV